MIRKISLALAFACAIPAHAVDGYSLEYGAGTGSTELARVGAHWNWQRKWFADRSWYLGGYWDAQLGYWKGDNSLVDVGLTPVFRLQPSQRGAWSPYFEGAIGFHLLSRTRINETRRFGTAFQFGDHLGAGLRFGNRGRYEFGMRVQHLSNGSIKHPNSGINFAILRFQLHLD